ncbi:hypothetical protein HPP92_022542 [Vanilla planifolia]|uniref:Uncharacterized protein n=1 Tax=Vanilla planifolia TaxID=51239 RepID=A0A835UDX3_VANPL|nr:hypothetical protein HPP92_022542 [Vanilla planifolia]
MKNLNQGIEALLSTHIIGSPLELLKNHVTEIALSLQKNYTYCLDDINILNHKLEQTLVIDQ